MKQKKQEAIIKKLSENIVTKKKSVPLYIQISDQMREYITLINTPNKDIQIPTEEKLSTYFNVSRDTIRKALKFLEDEKIIYKIQGAGIFINSLSEKIATKKIGLLFCKGFIGNFHPVSTQYLHGIYDVLKSNKVDYEIIEVEEELLDKPELYDYMKSCEVSGVISFISHKYLQKVIEHNLGDIPCIGKDIYAKNRVYNDYYDIYSKIVEYLIGHNHKNIGIIFYGYNNENKYNDIIYNQVVGVVEDIKFRYAKDDLNIEIIFNTNLDKLEEKSVLSKIKEVSITALITYDDLCAKEILSMFKKNNIVCPEDISLVSLGNYELAKHTNPPLTTYDLHFEKIGEEMANMVIELFDNNVLSSREVAGDFIIRNSVAHALK